MICANKIDLKADRVVSQEQGLEYAKKVDPESSEKFAKDKYIETSGMSVYISTHFIYHYC